MEDLARATQHLPEIHTIVKALRHKDAEGVDQDTLHPFSEENYIKKVTEQEEEAAKQIQQVEEAFYTNNNLTQAQRNKAAD